MYDYAASVQPMIDIDDLERLEPTRRANPLLSSHEDQWFERKSSRVSARDLADEMIGMANAEGGLIVIGAHDGRIETGWSASRRNDWRQASIDFTVPPVPMALTDLHVDFDGSEEVVVIVAVAPSERVHANRRDEVFLRVGDENRRLTFEQRQELEFDKGQSNFETTIPRVVDTQTLHADLLLDNEVANQLLDTTGARSIEGLLTARGLMTPDGRVTVGGLLLVGQNPQAELPAALVRVTRYRSADKASGARQQVNYDQRFEGPLATQLSDALDTIEEQIPTRRALGANGKFSEVAAIPRDAWLEGLVNAVTHRSYSMAGDHIRVSLFPDRIEVESPGRFPGVVDLSAPEGIPRFARNPRIARVLADLAFTQELGEGIRRIFEEMRLAGLAEPQYRQTAGSVLLTLSAEPVDLELEHRLPTQAREIVRIVRDRGRASTGELVTALGRSRPVVLKQLRTLEREELIEWVGNSPKDPRAYWRLPER